MADSMPNYPVEMQRLRSQILDLQTNIQKQVLQIMEMKDRKAKLLENITATRLAISDYQGKLHGLEQTHGVVTEDEINKILEGV